MPRACKSITDKGERCRAAPMQDADYCFWHDPEHQQAAADARRAGGNNRRRESTLQAVYDIEGLETAADIRRVLHIALMGELALENSHNRSRVLVSIATSAARILEVEELERRVESLEAALGPRLQTQKRGRR
jgi:hypothetical protein